MPTQRTKEELQQIFMERLTADGFRPTLDADGDVAFKFEGGSFFIRPSADDPQFHLIALPGIWTIETEADRARARLAALKVTGDIKVAKVVIYMDAVWVTAELFLPAPEVLGDVYERCLRAILSARRSFADAMAREEPRPSRETRDEALGPRGGQSLTCAGALTIDRPVLSPDAVTDAFEAKFIAWLEGDLLLKPISHAGSGALFWRVAFHGKTVDIGLIGRLRCPGTPLAEGVDWILRIEEEEPTDFVALVEEQFARTDRVRRRMYDGKTRVQFKSTELLTESVLA
jgi:hypothetical protein